MSPDPKPKPHTHGGLAEIIATKQAPGGLPWDAEHVYPHDDLEPRRYRTRADRRRHLTARGLEPL